MTPGPPAVAVCCSSASCVSVMRRAFSIAIKRPRSRLILRSITGGARHYLLLPLAHRGVAGGGHHRVGDKASVCADFVLDLIGDVLVLL